MSRYLVDKFIYTVDRSESKWKAYMEDPASYVTRWEEEEAPYLFSNPEERTSGHSFTQEERRALAEQDFETLYAMGAHGFLLWTLFIPLLEPKFSNFREMVDHYNSKIGPHGRPDVTT